MKAIIYAFLFGFALTWPYDPEKMLEYAKEYCDYEYPIYKKINREDGVSGIFVSKAIQYAGCSVMVCFEWVDEDYFIPKGYKLMNCLSKHGWKSSSRRPKDFEPGYPIFRKDDNAAMILDHFEGSSVYIYGHLFEYGYCNVYGGEEDEFIYYYL